MISDIKANTNSPWENVVLIFIIGKRKIVIKNANAILILTDTAGFPKIGIKATKANILANNNKKLNTTSSFNKDINSCINYK